MKNDMYYDVYHKKRYVPGVQLLALFRGRKGLFLLGAFVGVLSCYFAFPSMMQELAIWLENGLASLDGVAERGQDFFIYLSVQRLGLFALLVLFGMTKIRKLVFPMLCVIAGALAGSIGLAFCFAYGWKGILAFFACMFPHWIIYIILFEYIYWLFCENLEDTETIRKETEKEYGRKQNDDAYGRKLNVILRMIGHGVVAVCLLGLAIYMEWKINPTLLMLVRKIL